MKKYLLSIFFVAAMLVAPAAAADLFPVEQIAADGFTSWGYMDDSGKQAIPFQYQSASAFTEDGFASVTNSNGSTAVIDETGKVIVSFRTAPDSVAFDTDEIAFQYENFTIYFDKHGQEIAQIPGASGFFSAEGLVTFQDDSGLWGYAAKDGSITLPAVYRQAGAFTDGFAVVQLTDGGYAVIDCAGNALTLPRDAVPVYPEVYGGKLLVLSNGTRSALYTFSTEKDAAGQTLYTGAYLSDYIYQEISAFHDGCAAARLNNRWGILNLNGMPTVDFQYNYLSYMGSGVYAARGEDGASAIDASGALIYRTFVYVGGFQDISHGVAWHGTTDSGIIFFSKVGGYITKLDNAEKPTILTSDVALVTIGGTPQYVRLHDKKILYSPARSYDLGYCKITSTSYEKYLGTDKSGQEYGISLTYPVVSGMADRTVQSKINDAIESFFLDGPALATTRTPVSGSYGVRLRGRLLIVWADCISGSGDGSTIWNDNITLDLATGETYNLTTDLLNKNYASVVRKLLPSDIPMYLFSYPRITEHGISFYYNTLQNSQKGQRAPASTAYKLTFDQLRDALRTDSECYRALNGTAVGTLDQYKGYADVPEGHWAYAAIQAVSEADLMHGDGTHFQPDKTITGAEIASIMVRFLQLDTSTIAAPAGSPWYYIEATAAERAGLTAGLDDPIAYTSAMSRADAMQILANTLQKRSMSTLSAAEADTVLSRFSDASLVPANRKNAAALCVKAGLIVGSNGKLGAQQSFTRAQFAQILSVLLA